MYQKTKIAHLVSTLLLVSTITIPTFAATDQNDEQKIVNFLISDNSSVGATYVGSASSLNGKILPLSYYSTPDYWGKYVCQLSGNDCTVVDEYNDNNYTLVPSQNSPGADLQVERINVGNGTDIYDAACWQIGLAVAAKNGVKGPGGQNLFDIANNENDLLSAGYDGNASNNFDEWANRAFTQDWNNQKIYNYHGIIFSKANAKNAYFYRMVTRNWLSTDPFTDTSYLTKYVTATNLPPKNKDYALGKVTWLDWKPITGENAWAFFIGPLQNAYLRSIQTDHQNYVPFGDVAIQNALNVLPAFRAMQSQLGAFYYAVPGSLGNTGNQPVNPYDVSVENNASALAGLEMFSQVLQQELKNNSSLSKADQTTAINALNDINTMIYGGLMPEGSDHVYTNGLLNFFKNYAWQKGEFIQGGLANEPNKPVWQPTTEPKAVDVNTWGLTVLGQPLVDSWFGAGAAYQAWQDVKSWGGFTGPNNQLWGVGYSDSQQGKSYCESGSYNTPNSIISAEWTAGAITMANVLSQQYSSAGQANYATALSQDASSMQQGMSSLRSDNYPTAQVYSNARPEDYAKLIPVPSDKLSYVYASRRCFIPFGWQANPLPSTTSTAWGLMLDFNFNPFTLGGGSIPNPFLYGNLAVATTINVTNEVKDTQKIAINYKVQGNSNWNYGPQITKTGSVTLPVDTSLVQVVYTKDGSNWYPACQLANPQKIAAFATIFGGANHVTLNASWTDNEGSGECPLVGN